MAGINRRTFLKGAAGASAFLIAGTKTSGKVFGANERLNIAVAGLRGRGRSHMGAYDEMDNVNITWLIDPDRRLLRENSRARSGVRTTTDLREALADESLDAVSVAAPNHWHSMYVIEAAKAGKHCFVEKPASHDIYEGRVALAAAEKYGVVVQHGTQQRSSQERADMIKAIRSGKYGRLVVSHGFACKTRSGIGYDMPSATPPWLDWNQWRGHAVLDRFHWEKYVHYDWHWFWETGNGDLNNQGTHQLDVAFWGLDEDMTHPERVMCLGGRFAWDDQGATPNSQFAIARYPNGQYVFFNVRNVDYDGYEHQVENRFYFEDGGKIIGNNYISPQGETYPVEGEPADIVPGGNYGSFINTCFAGDPAKSNATMEVAHYSSLLGHTMNNSYRIGDRAPFNKSVGRFEDIPFGMEEFETFHEIMRDGVGLPEDGTEYVVGPWLDFDKETERFTGERADEANRLLRDPRMPEFDIPTPDAV
jgi:predicted dehydrogenase